MNHEDQEYIQELFYQQIRALTKKNMNQGFDMQFSDCLFAWGDINGI